MSRLRRFAIGFVGAFVLLVSSVAILPIVKSSALASSGQVAATIGGLNNPRSIAVNSTTNLAYVLSGNPVHPGQMDILVIDLRANTVAATITGVSGALWIAVNQATNQVYVSCPSAHSVVVIDGATNTVVGSITVSAIPGRMAVNPATNLAYLITSTDSQHPGDHLVVIDGSTNQVISTVGGFDGASGLAVDGSTNTVYVADEYAKKVEGLDGVTDTISSAVSLSFEPSAIAVNPSTNTIFAREDGGSGLAVIDGLTNTVTLSTTTSSVGYDIAVNPRTNTVYLPDFYTDPSIFAGLGNVVEVFDGNTNTFLSPVSVGSAPFFAAVDVRSNTVYVTDFRSGAVSAFRGATNQNISLPIDVGANPSSEAYRPSSNSIYVANNSDNTISVVDASSQTVTHTIAVGGSPDGITYDVANDSIYVANFADGTVSVIDGSTNLVTSTISVGSNPRGVAVDPTSDAIFVANSSDGTVSVIDGSTNLVSSTITVGSGPADMAFDASTGVIYVACIGDNSVQAIDVSTNTVALTTSVTNPVALAVNPTTNLVYVANGGSFFSPGKTVTVLDATTLGSVGSPITVGYQPSALSVDANANAIYVANAHDGTISKIDGASATVVAPLFSVGMNPAALVLGAGAVVVANADDGTVNFLNFGQVPDAPSSVIGTPGDGQVSVSWTAPSSDGGSPITGYTATSTPGSKSCSTTGSTSCTIAGLSNGTSYSFTVTATNAIGTGSSSLPSSSVAPSAPITAPGAPQSVVGVAGSAQVSLSWTAPTSDGGSPITGYTATSTPGSFSCTTTGATSCVVQGLVNGTSYTFSVTAVNALSSGPASAASSAVTPATIPDPPTGVSAKAGNASAVVSWTAPTSNGGSLITGYTATSTPGSKTCSTTGATSCTITGLLNGTAYTFKVVATNGVGTGGASSASGAVTPATIPDPPSGVSAKVGNASVLVSWTAPTSNGGSLITGYTATSTPGSKSCSVDGATSCTITGLLNGTAYTFKVVATNGVGVGGASAASGAVTPATVPDPPTGVSAQAGNASAVVSWTAPTSNGGSRITGYTATSTPGSKFCSTSGATSCTITGLLNGTAYTFKVVATNGVGAGAASVGSPSKTPSTVPGTPTGVSAQAGNASAVVSWTAPTSNGGSPITGYTAISTPGSKSCSTSGATSCTISGLSNGTAYTFSVIATNVAGSSATSQASQAKTPSTVPGAPTHLALITGNGKVTVSWSAPISTGGSPILRYLVTSSPGAKTCQTVGTSCVVTGLSNGVSYSFRVQATNARGTGLASANSSVTPHAARARRVTT